MKNKIRNSILFAALTILSSLGFTGTGISQQPAAPAAATETVTSQLKKEVEGGKGTKAPGISTPLVAVPLTNNIAELTPANTTVEFIGSHIGPQPDPRLGGFSNFSGKLKMTDDGKLPASLTMEFSIESLWTEIGEKLTNHLKAADFLNAAEYPTAKFASTKIEPGAQTGLITITGDFTLHGKTQPLTFSATLSVTDVGVLLASNFELDRTKFGMGEYTDKVASLVSLRLAVGEKTKSATPQPAPMVEAANGNRRGNFDPAAMFKERDANSDGKLTGDEIPARMQERLEAFDTDNDGSITLEEIQERMKAFSGGR